MEDQVPKVRNDWAWVAAAPLGWPVVPEVKMRSDRSSGRTAAARAAVVGRVDTLARSQEGVQPGQRHPAAPCRWPPSSRRRRMRARSPVSWPSSRAG